MRRALDLLIVLALAAACEPGPRPLVAGVDTCDFCRMTVSDTRFGGEILSAGGRIRTFDAVECLASFHLDATARDDVRGAWVADFETTRLVPVDSAVFVSGGSIASPMGRSLVAFAPEHARAAAGYGGRVLTWTDVLAAMREDRLTPGVHPHDTAGVRPN